MYYKLKTSFLEDTLNDVLNEDGFDLEADEGDDMFDDSLCQSLNGGPALPLDISAIVGNDEQNDRTANSFSNLQELPSTSALTNLVNRSENEVLKNFEAEEECSTNKTAWGDEVSKKPTAFIEKSENSKASSKNFKSSLSDKLLKSASFNKRNPRKSLSRSNLDSSLRGSKSSLNQSVSKVADNKEVLPDLETILIQKAKEKQAAAAIAANPLLVAGKYH